MKLMRAMLCAVILGAFSVPAVAAPAKAKKPTPTKVKKSKKAKFNKSKTAKRSKKARKGKTKLAAKRKNQRIKKYDFLGDKLEGDIVRPDGEGVVGRTGVRFSNLINFRLSFLPEITKAGEDL